jgi:hypothetical protein
MIKPPIGNSQINQALCSLIWVTHSKATKKKAEADPENNPIKTQMTSHCKERRSVFDRFIFDCSD